MDSSTFHMRESHCWKAMSSPIPLIRVIGEWVCILTKAGMATLPLQSIISRSPAKGHKALLPCDMLLAETGHHPPVKVARDLLESGVQPGVLCFIHHGRDILADAAGQYREVRAVLGERVRILDDQTTLRV